MYNWPLREWKFYNQEILNESAKIITRINPLTVKPKKKHGEIFATYKKSFIIIKMKRKKFKQKNYVEVKTNHPGSGNSLIYCNMLFILPPFEYRYKIVYLPQELLKFSSLFLCGKILSISISFSLCFWCNNIRVKINIINVWECFMVPSPR